mmetsp:Transcript_21672/g.60545  ORF Transcript_21672/g.60545 Transcript_21672/m.60545 type:complete len:221 (-) Transcript_21672:306-968(-)
MLRRREAVQAARSSSTGAGKRHRLGLSLSSSPKKAPPPAHSAEKRRWWAGLDGFWAPGSLHEPARRPPMCRSKTCREEVLWSKTPKKRPWSKAREPGPGTVPWSFRRSRLGTSCGSAGAAPAEGGPEAAPRSRTRRAEVATTTQSSSLLPSPCRPAEEAPPWAQGAVVKAESSSGSSNPALALASSSSSGSPPRSSNHDLPTARSTSTGGAAGSASSSGQ